MKSWNIFESPAKCHWPTQPSAQRFGIHRPTSFYPTGGKGACPAKLRRNPTVQEKVGIGLFLRSAQRTSCGGKTQNCRACGTNRGRRRYSLYGFGNHYIPRLHCPYQTFPRGLTFKNRCFYQFPDQFKYYASGFPVNLIGGEYRPNRKDFCGYLAEESVKNLFFTKCFLGADGCSIQNGFTAMDFSSARLNEEVLHRTQKCIILMDAEKFSTSAVVSYTRRRMPDCVMTDKAPPEEISSYLQEQKVNILIAGPDNP